MRLHSANMHAIPSVEREHLANHWTRVRHYRAYVAGVVDVLAMRRGGVLLHGDMNAEPTNPLLRPFRRIGLRQVIGRPTHHGDTFDQVWASRNLVVLATRVLAIWSDHKAAGVSVTDRRRRWMRRTATANLGNGTDAAVIESLNRLARSGYDVVNCQEAGDRHAAIVQFLAFPVVGSWGVYFGDGTPGAASLPILWREDRTGPPVAKRTRLIVPRTYLGPAGAGPAWAKAKVLNRVAFRVRGRRSGGTTDAVERIGGGT